MDSWLDFKAELFRSVAILTAVALFLLMGTLANQTDFDGKAQAQVVCGKSN